MRSCSHRKEQPAALEEEFQQLALRRNRTSLCRSQTRGKRQQLLGRGRDNHLRGTGIEYSTMELDIGGNFGVIVPVA